MNHSANRAKEEATNHGPRIVTNSKEVSRGSIFIAIKGGVFNGHDFVAEALSKGAALCIVSEEEWRNLKKRVGDAKILPVKDTREELSKLASELYDKPCEKLKVIGITGTNGKTTVSFLIDKIFSDNGQKTGVIGTISYKVGNTVITADRTTPDALRLHFLLGEMVRKHVFCAILEVSSHALHQKRVAHLYYDTAVFTNITPEHLDYHGTMQAYFDSKAGMFKNLKSGGCAVLNNDDPKSKVLAERLRSRVITYGISGRSDVSARAIRMSLAGSCFEAITPRGIININTKLLGKHNISNVLASIAVAVIHGIDLKKIEKSINSFTCVPGRLEVIDAGQGFRVFVDYAHTKDALFNVLSTLRPFADKRLIAVFGCGGDRDRTKRSEMGLVASRFADYIIITDDNSRSESPKKIAAEIIKGIEKNKVKYSIILKRERAIKTALDAAREGDVVIIAGKGHETKQITRGRVTEFDDRVMVRKILDMKKRGIS